MNIQSLEIKNDFLGWNFDKIFFSHNLTLLVGISGVGKTQILRSIDDLKDVAGGRAINGFNWKISFTTFNKKTYLWEGAFSTIEEIKSLFRDYDDDSQIKPVILYERLKCGDEFIIERSSEEIKFEGKTMPKLSSTESTINTLKEEVSIKEVHDSFKKIIFKDHTRSDTGLHFTGKSLSALKDKFKNIDDIKNSNENIRIKLFLCAELNLPVFEIIKNKFFEVFSQVEDLKIAQVEDDFYPFRVDQTIPIFSIKETDVPKWINEDKMSSGMLRTIVHISEIYLSNDGSVILIDEFENSLGINCIDILTDDLIHENKNLQFIATSHHPYIINNIPYEYWKIVSRRGGHISVGNAADYHLGKSKQEAFIQLIKVLDKQI